MIQDDQLTFWICVGAAACVVALMVALGILLVQIGALP
jgi:hypothetical protein